MTEGTDCDLSALVQLIFANADSIDEKVHNVVDYGVLIVALCDQFQHIFIVLFG